MAFKIISLNNVDTSIYLPMNNNDSMISNYTAAIYSGIMFNAINDIKMVVTNTVTSIWSDRPMFINKDIKEQLFDLVQKSYIDKGSFTTFMIGVRSSVYDTIGYDNKKEISKNNKLYLVGKPNEDVNEYGNYVLDKNVLNLDVADMSIASEHISEIYKKILDTDYVPPKNNSGNEIGAGVYLSKTFKNRIETLNNIHRYADDIGSKESSMIQYLYDSEYNSGISAGTYAILDISKLEYSNDIIYSETISKAYRIKCVGNVDVYMNIRGIDIPYKVTRLSKNYLLAQIPEYLLTPSNDNMNSISYIKFVYNSDKIDEIKYQVYEPVYDTEMYNNVLNNANLLKKE